MKGNKKLFSFVLLVNLIFVFSFGDILGCKQTKEAGYDKDFSHIIKLKIGCKQAKEAGYPQTKETHNNNMNRLTQNLPLSKEIIQDKSVFYKCDLQRTGVFKGENPKLKGEVLWKLEMKEKSPEKFVGCFIGRHSSPIIFEDILYIGNIDNNVYAINANTGELLWKFQTGGPITSSPALWNRTLYFGSEDSFFYAVNIDTHKLRWKYRTDGPIFSSPAIAEEIVFFGSTDGIFYALDALTGEEKWRFNTKQSISCNPAILKGRVYFVSNPKQTSTNSNSSKQNKNLPMIFALDLLTGEEIWHLEANEGYLGNFCIVEGESTIDELYVGFYTLITSPDIYEIALSCAGIINIDISFDTHKVSRLLSFYPSHRPFLPDPSCNGTTLCFGPDGIYAINIGNTRKIGEKYQDCILHGEYIWEYKVRAYSRRYCGSTILTPLAFSGDGSMVYFGGNNGCLYGIDANICKELFLLYVFSLSSNEKLIEGKLYHPDISFVITPPFLYKNKLYIYVGENYCSDVAGCGDSKLIGVLYCIQ